MIELITPKIEITPGQRGQLPQDGMLARGVPLPGSILIRIKNDIGNAQRNNRFVIGIRCEDSRWQSQWVSVIQGLNAAAIGQDVARDHFDQRERKLTIWLSSGQERDVLIRTDVPRHPDARAGRYNLIVEVTTEIPPQQAASAARQNPKQEIAVPATILPFYEWQADIAPVTRKRGIVRRTAPFDLQVTNLGNDWLYCDLALPARKDIRITTDTARLAVPPAEAGQTVNLLSGTGETEARAGSQRSVPLCVRLLGMRGLVGAPTEIPLNLTLRRVDAPTLPRPSDDPMFPRDDALLSLPATEPPHPVPSDRAIVFNPWIPSFVGAAPGKTIGLITQLAMAVVGFLVVGHLLIVGFYQFLKNFNEVELNNLTLKSTKERIKFRARNLLGARVYITSARTGPLQVPVKPSSDIVNTVGDYERWSVPVPDDFQAGDLLTVHFDRSISWLPYLGPPLLPHKEATIQIAKPAEVARLGGDPAKPGTPAGGGATPPSTPAGGSTPASPGTPAGGGATPPGTPAGGSTPAPSNTKPGGGGTNPAPAPANSGTNPGAVQVQNGPSDMQPLLDAWCKAVNDKDYDAKCKDLNRRAAEHKKANKNDKKAQAYLMLTAMLHDSPLDINQHKTVGDWTQPIAEIVGASAANPADTELADLAAILDGLDKFRSDDLDGAAAAADKSKHPLSQLIGAFVRAKAEIEKNKITVLKEQDKRWNAACAAAQSSNPGYFAADSRFSWIVDINSNR